jgi:hypothetical protein
MPLQALLTEVAGMTQTADPSPGSTGSTENPFSPKDAERIGFHIGSHTQEMFFSGLAVLLAVVGAALIAFPSLHILGGWIALAGIIVGLYAQLTSDTTVERMVNVVAIGVAALAFAFHIHHGGIWF